MIKNITLKTIVLVAVLVSLFGCKEAGHPTNEFGVLVPTVCQESVLSRLPGIQSTFQIETEVVSIEKTANPFGAAQNQFSMLVKLKSVTPKTELEPIANGLIRGCYPNRKHEIRIDSTFELEKLSDLLREQSDSTYSYILIDEENSKLILFR